MKKDTKMFTAEQRESFVRGWDSAGGYIEDTGSSSPWCCPWYHRNTIIDVQGSSLEEWGASWWIQCREEIAALLEDEEAVCYI